jgi:sporulation protein YlmC with PRC-barrel domain
MIKQVVIAVAAASSLSAAALAATTMSTAPQDGRTVTDYYKQSVYNADQTKVGSIDDVLVNSSGQVTGLVISVGGFLGMDTKDVIVPFSDVKMTMKDNKQWLTIPETKAELKSAQGFSYNSTTTKWEPAKA